MLRCHCLRYIHVGVEKLGSTEAGAVVDTQSTTRSNGYLSVPSQSEKRQNRTHSFRIVAWLDQEMVAGRVIGSLNGHSRPAPKPLEAQLNMMFRWHVILGA